MLTLGVDSSGRAASCALMRGDMLLAESYIDTGLTHSHTLLPMIESMLSRAGTALGDIERLAVSVGPGSFTGVRIGVSTVKGLSFGLDISCVGVSALAAMAHLAAGLYTGSVCPVMDARAGQVYAALFETAHGTVTRKMEDSALSIEDLRAVLPSGTLLLGDGAHLIYEENGGFNLAPGHQRLQRAVGVVLAAGGLPDTPAEGLLPVYLRRPQAERMLIERQSGDNSPDTKGRNLT